MPESLIDEIRKALKGEKKNEFIDQILKEKALYDALREAGYVLTTEDIIKARELPYGALTHIQKIDEVGKVLEDVGVSLNANNIGNLPIDIKASTIGDIPIKINSMGLNNIPINIKANDLGNLPIAINANNIGNIPIDLKAQSVDMNIKTSSGANIIIDKLTQSAYTENQRTLSNNGATAGTKSVTGDYREGKFFPRGCRGFLQTIEIYCRDMVSEGGTITVYLAPNIGMGYIASATITVEAGGSWAWRSATFNMMWNYDSMFIFVVCSTSNIKYGYDSGQPNDAYISSDAGATWAFENYRFWFRANISGATVGDLPISGTVNTIELPNEVVMYSGSQVVLPHNSFTKVAEFKGCGRLFKSKVFYMTTVVPSALVNYGMLIKCDGVDAFVFGNIEATQQYDATYGHCAIGTFCRGNNRWQLYCYLQVPFRKLIELYAIQTTGANIDGYGELDIIKI